MDTGVDRSVSRHGGGPGQSVVRGQFVANVLDDMCI